MRFMSQIVLSGFGYFGLRTRTCAGAATIGRSRNCGTSSEVEIANLVFESSQRIGQRVAGGMERDDAHVRSFVLDGEHLGKEGSFVEHRETADEIGYTNRHTIPRLRDGVHRTHRLTAATTQSGSIASMQFGLRSQAER